MFEEGWWYRVQGDPAEKFFPVPDTQNYTGAVATLTWNDVDGRGFSAVKVLTVTDMGGLSGYVEGELTLTNNNATDLSIDVFHAFDMDLAVRRPVTSASSSRRTTTSGSRTAPRSVNTGDWMRTRSWCAPSAIPPTCPAS